MFESSMLIRDPYIDIHTHHVSPDHGVCVLNNRLIHDEPYHTTTLFSIGVHPWDAGLVGEGRMAELERWLKHPHCLALGECGLDKVQGPDLQLQKTVFGAQLVLAEAYRKPVIIHCVKAFDELMELAGPYASKLPLIIHGFHKSSQLAAQLIGKGFFLSLNPTLLHREAFDFTVIPLDRLFLETDMRSELPIQVIYRQAALRFNVAEDELKEKISRNFESLKQHT